MNNVKELMNRGVGCPIPLTAATSLYVVTHSVITVYSDYSCMCVGCWVELECRVQRETDSQQTIKQLTVCSDTSTTATYMCVYRVQIRQSVCCRGTQLENAQEMQALSGPHT